MFRMKRIRFGSKSEYLNLKINLPKFRLPERLRGGRIEKWANYWTGVGTDYREALFDIAKDCRAKPIKASIYITALCGAGYAFKHNPDAAEFQDALQQHMNDSALLGVKIRNPDIDKHFNYLVDCFNHDLIRRLSFGFGSFLWIDNYSENCGIYKARCSYLKPRYLTFHERIVDVGFCGIWWILRDKFKDFDVNPEEWKEQELQSQNKTYDAKESLVKNEFVQS